ncbi:hypothetical protein D3C72_2168830 [compost metagenome]
MVIPFGDPEMIRKIGAPEVHVLGGAYLQPHDLRVGERALVLPDAVGDVAEGIDARALGGPLTAAGQGVRDLVV